MAVKRKRVGTTQNTTFATSSYGGGSKGLTTANGKTSQGGKFISRRQQYGNVRRGLGLSGG